MLAVIFLQSVQLQMKVSTRSSPSVGCEGSVSRSTWKRGLLTTAEFYVTSLSERYDLRIQVAQLRSSMLL